MRDHRGVLRPGPPGQNAARLVGRDGSRSESLEEHGRQVALTGVAHDRDDALYNANKKMDADADGIACEKS